MSSPYKTPYDEGYTDGEEMAQKRIADLNAYISEIERGKIEALDEVAEQARLLDMSASREARLQTELAELRAAAQEFFNKEMGGAAEAYAAKNRLRALLQESSDE